MTALTGSSETSRTIAPSTRQVRIILIGTALLLALGMGIRQSMGLFVTPVSRDLAISVTDFTLALAIQNIVWGLSQALVGGIADRFGLRITMTAGAAIYVGGLSDSIEGGVRLAEQAIDSGAANDLMERFVAKTQELAA